MNVLDSLKDRFIISPEEDEEVEKSASSLKDIGGIGSVLSGCTFLKW